MANVTVTPNPLEIKTSLVLPVNVGASSFLTILGWDLIHFELNNMLNRVKRLER